jgi:hypothetical protein
VEGLAKFDKIKLETFKESLYNNNESPQKDKAKSREKVDRIKPSAENASNSFKK